jgi:hypothetical protein
MNKTSQNLNEEWRKVPILSYPIGLPFDKRHDCLMPKLIRVRAAGKNQISWSSGSTAAAYFESPGFKSRAPIPAILTAVFHGFLQSHRKNTLNSTTAASFHRPILSNAYSLISLPCDSILHGLSYWHRRYVKYKQMYLLYTWTDCCRVKFCAHRPTTLRRMRTCFPCILLNSHYIENYFNKTRRLDLKGI